MTDTSIGITREIGRFRMRIEEDVIDGDVIGALEHANGVMDDIETFLQWGAIEQPWRKEKVRCPKCGKKVHSKPNKQNGHSQLMCHSCNWSDNVE